MNVPYPMFITSRLEAGLKIDGRAYGAKTSGTVSVFELGGGDFGYRIEDEKGKTLEVVKGGQGIMHCPIVDDYGEPMRALLDFLTAAAESYHYEGGLGEYATLFKRKTVEWAWQHSDELEMARWELEPEEES
jgi:hypothetical protein